MFIKLLFTILRSVPLTNIVLSPQGDDLGTGHAVNHLGSGAFHSLPTYEHLLPLQPPSASDKQSYDTSSEEQHAPKYSLFAVESNPSILLATLHIFKYLSLELQVSQVIYSKDACIDYLLNIQHTNTRKTNVLLHKPLLLKFIFVYNIIILI